MNAWFELLTWNCKLNHKLWWKLSSRSRKHSKIGTRGNIYTQHSEKNRKMMSHIKVKRFYLSCLVEIFSTKRHKLQWQNWEQVIIGGWGAWYGGPVIHAGSTCLSSAMVSCGAVVNSRPPPPCWYLAPWTPSSPLCDPNHWLHPHQLPWGARPKTTFLLCLNHTSCSVYVCAYVCVLSRVGFHISCLKWNQKLGFWTGVLEACVWQRNNFALWIWVSVFF